MKIAKLRIPTELVYGNDAASKIGEYSRHLGASRVLLISDHGVNQVGIIDNARTWIEEAGIGVVSWLEVEAEPSTDSLHDCIALARESQCDTVVAIGGGSVLDSAKAVAVLLTNEGDPDDFLGSERVTQRGVPTILAPTTAGTGAEITPNALFYVPSRRAKEAIVSRKIIPDVAIIDPMLTLSCPPALTAATGMDALSHAIESYTGLNATPLSLPFSRHAIRLIGTHLRTATLHGNNIAAREGMALGSLNAAIAIANSGTNGVHALAYPIQGLHRIQHGIANSVLLPTVMDFNILGDLERFAEITQLLGFPTQNMSLRQAAQASVDACRQLSIDIGIPQTLQELGIEAQQIDSLVEGAMEVTRLLRNNPRPMKREDIQGIFQQAF